MGEVGLGFGSFRPAVRVSRLPKNPLDKCTLVSVYPERIVDYKATAFPSKHVIEGAADGDFSIAVVGPVSWYKELEEGQPLLEIPSSSIQVAEAFIRDHVNGLLGYNPSNASPGLFFIPGEYTKTSILKYVSPEGETFAAMLLKARERQKNWFAQIVKLADTMWSRTNGNPLAISRDARIAAEKLNLKSKPWMQDFQMIEKINCKACGNMVNPMYPVCPNCKAIVNADKAKELNIQFAN